MMTLFTRAAMAAILCGLLPGAQAAFVAGGSAADCAAGLGCDGE